jgi:hypothetical protein
MNERWEFFKLEDSKEESLDRIGQLLSSDPNINVHVSLYQNDDTARGKIVRIKNYIADKYQIDLHRIRTSWFRVLEKEICF